MLNYYASFKFARNIYLGAYSCLELEVRYFIVSMNTWKEVRLGVVLGC